MIIITGLIYKSAMVQWSANWCNVALVQCAKVHMYIIALCTTQQLLLSLIYKRIEQGRRFFVGHSKVFPPSLKVILKSICMREDFGQSVRGKKREKRVF